MRRLTLLISAGLAITAGPAAAQSWSGTYDGRYSYSGSGGHDSDGYSRRSYGNAVPSSFDWRSQLDRPGDYRCDAFWDASRNDCGERWRDQRSRVSAQARRDYRQLAGDRRNDHAYDRFGHDGYTSRGRGYGSGVSYNPGGTAYQGAYGRPDLVYPAGSRSYGSGGSQASRADWCRAAYRSYNPYTGYYRAYSGRLIYCG